MDSNPFQRMNKRNRDPRNRDPRNRDPRDFHREQRDHHKFGPKYEMDGLAIILDNGLNQFLKLRDDLDEDKNEIQ